LQLAALQARKRVEDEVSEFLTGEKFGYSFRASARCSASADDRVYSTLSGAEWVRCISALRRRCRPPREGRASDDLAVYVVPTAPSTTTASARSTRICVHFPGSVFLQCVSVPRGRPNAAWCRLAFGGVGADLEAADL